MKNSNYIAESVFKVKFNYELMQNKTEELFFRCLDEEQSPEYFEKEINKIWGNVDHKFMDDEIQRYREIIHEQITGRQEELTENSGDLFALVPISVFIIVENNFKKIKTKEYERSYKFVVKADKEEKDEYTKMELAKYTNDMKPYYKKGMPKTKDNVVRTVSPAVYNSMVHNTNITREGWNQTMEDADEVGANYFIIPYHSFSCPHCMAHQERLLTRSDIISMAGKADEAEGDILHPNCQCKITIWNPKDKIPKSKLSKGEKEEISVIRQKMNVLTLEKERVRTKMKIAESDGYMDEYDKYNQQRNKINKEIRKLKEALPTTELRKQVVAIHRLKD